MDANADSLRTMIKPPALLQVASGAAQGTQIAVPPGGLVLGRDGPPEGRLGDDPALSRLHAVIVHSDRGELLVSDLGSANGTYLNGSRVEDSAPVRPGDIIELGSTTLTASGPVTGAPPVTGGPAPGAAQTLITPARPVPAQPAHRGAAQAAPPLARPAPVPAAPGPERPPAPGWPYAQAPGQHARGGRQYPPPGQPLTPAPRVPAAGGYGRYPAAAVPEGMYYDQVSGLVLPQGTQLATVGRRIGACFLTIPLPLILIGGLLAWANGWVNGYSRVLQVSLITLGIGYLVWGLLAWGEGQSPALQMLGLRCWRPKTQRVAGWGTMALREIIGRIVDSLFLVTLLVSVLLFLTGKEHKSLHDHVAGTVVLHDPGQVLSR
jgi:uncharacterized RDD family membrane protein YckC